MNVPREKMADHIFGQGSRGRSGRTCYLLIVGMCVFGNRLICSKDPRSPDGRRCYHDCDNRGDPLENKDMAMGDLRKQRESDHL